MARFPMSLRDRRRRRILNRIYIVSALVVAGVIMVFVFGGNPFGRTQPVAGPEPASAATAQQPQPQPEQTSPPPSPPKEEPQAPPVTGPEPVVLPGPQPEPPSTVSPATAASNPEVSKLINQALDYINASPSKIIQARELLNEALLLPMNGEQLRYVKQQLSWLADKWLFSRSVFANDRLCSSYQVRPGDQLRTIGEQFKVPYQILMEINNIKRPELLQAGQVIKVVKGPFHAKVYRSSFTMDLYLQRTFVRSFTVGLGKPGMETPTGTWLVAPGGKLIKPVWTDPVSGRTYRPTDPDYPLGSRWIGLQGIEGQAVGRTGFAIHGTKDPDEIGAAVSQGCIRMFNGDAILMYNLLMPGYSKIQVID